MQTPLYPPLLKLRATSIGFGKVPLALDARGRYAVDRAAFAAATGPTRIFLLCNPGGGTVFTRGR
jgi:bifunctional pyridoxal-dependent enzyme with beta-cystathionase and maltose regulon repressor activities